MDKPTPPTSTLDAKVIDLFPPPPESPPAVRIVDVGGTKVEIPVGERATPPLREFNQAVPADWTERGAEYHAKFWRLEAMHSEMSKFFAAIVDFAWEGCGDEPEFKDYPALSAAPMWEVLEVARIQSYWEETETILEEFARDEFGLSRADLVARFAR